MDEKTDLLQQLPLDTLNIIYNLLPHEAFFSLSLTSKKYLSEINKKYLQRFQIDFPYLLDAIEQFDEGFLSIGRIWWNLKSKLEAKLSDFEKNFIQTVLKYSPKESIIHSEELRTLINKSQLITEQHRKVPCYQYGKFYTYHLTNYLGLLGYWNVIYLMYHDEIIHCDIDRVAGGVDWLLRMRQREPLFEYLRTTSFDIANADDDFMTSLSVAIKFNFRAGVSLLLHYGALPQYEGKVNCYGYGASGYRVPVEHFNKQAKYIPNPLHVAAQYGHFFPDLLNYHSLDLNRLNASGETAVTVAVRMGRIDFIKKMLEQTIHPQLVNLNCGDILPLHTAVRKNYYNIACLLLKHGANPHQKDKKGYTPLRYAYKFGWKKIILKLKEYGAADYYKVGINYHLSYLYRSIERKIIQELDEIPTLSNEQIKKYQANLKTPWAKSPIEFQPPINMKNKSADEIKEIHKAEAIKTEQANKAASEIIDIIYQVVSPKKSQLEIFYKKETDPILQTIRSEIENFRNSNLLISSQMNRDILNKLINKVSKLEDKPLKVQKVYELMIGLRKKLENDVNHHALDKFIRL